MIIAIDGPAGSGKGTITKIIADRLGIVNIDTGAMYRCIALAFLRSNLSIEDKEGIIALTKKIKIKFGENGKVFLDDEEVSGLIRTKEISTVVSPISSIVEVREQMVKSQRKLAEGCSIIMEGRDITTVVFPNADYKFYLDATLEERARRRFKQNQEAGIEMSYEEVLESIRKRDYNDMHKEVGSLTRTEDQIYIDSTNLTIEEVAQEILKHIKER
ncbi:MAG: (d)CMP kinase [Bacilli bacterium]|nr:(d)CMP kinase [Bacilli bacterium]